ncbi:MAG: tripartite tricarboxylate transporter substrate binding protein, partial [Burkholderiales bacterium]
MIKRHQILIFVLAALAWHFPSASWAQSTSTGSGHGYPAKPVRYVVPFPAGGSPDIIARLIGERFSRMWG